MKQRSFLESRSKSSPHFNSDSLLRYFLFWRKKTGNRRPVNIKKKRCIRWEFSRSLKVKKNAFWDPMLRATIRLLCRCFRSWSCFIFHLTSKRNSRSFIFFRGELCSRLPDFGIEIAGCTTHPTGCAVSTRMPGSSLSRYFRSTRGFIEQLGECHATL